MFLCHSLSRRHLPQLDSALELCHSLLLDPAVTFPVYCLGPVLYLRKVPRLAAISQPTVEPAATLSGYRPWSLAPFEWSVKFTFGLLFVGVGMFVIAVASLFTGNGKVSPLWLIAVYFIHTIGELCLSPVGLSTVTKLSPARMVGLMMGVWFLATSIGNYLAGTAAGFYQDSGIALFRLFGSLGLATFLGAGLLFLLLPFARRLTQQDSPQVNCTPQ